MTTDWPRSDVILDRLTGLHPKLIDLSLGRMERLLENLDHPENYLPPTIHVAGTNGKGSVLAYLRAMFEAAGKKVHVYTSPHLVRFQERIRLNGKLISEHDLAVQLEECEVANGGQPITFFEITTAMAYLAFAREPADVLLLETGLGGRLDATNVIKKPKTTIITPVSMDHRQFLGDELASIAWEKAGIIKPGVPLVLAAQERDADAAIRARAEELRAPVYGEGTDWMVREQDKQLVFEGATGRHVLPLPTLVGEHQKGNAGTALAAFERFRSGQLDDPSVARGLTAAEWPARLQRLADGPLTAIPSDDSELWLDGGHNPAAGAMLANHARANWTDRPLHLICGMMNSKDTLDFLRPLNAVAVSFQAVVIPGEENSLSATDLADAALGAGLHAWTAANVSAALTQIRALEDGPVRILICGSLYLAGTVLTSNAKGAGSHKTP